MTYGMNCVISDFRWSKLRLLRVRINQAWGEKRLFIATNLVVSVLIVWVLLVYGA